MILVNGILGDFFQEFQYVEWNYFDLFTIDLEQTPQFLGCNIDKVELPSLSFLFANHVLPVLTVILAHDLQKFKGSSICGDA